MPYDPSPVISSSSPLDAEPGHRTPALVDIDWSGWLRMELEPRLLRLAQLEPGWDTYGAPAISHRALQHARQIAEIFLRVIPGLPCPEVVPTPGGGVALEWERGDDYATVEFNPTAWLVAYSTDGDEIEDEEPSNVGPFLEALRRLVTDR